MGTGVMIGAGIFALTGQIAELAGPLFPLSFMGAVVTAFSAYTYVKMSNAFPSAGGTATVIGPQASFRIIPITVGPSAKQPFFFLAGRWAFAHLIGPSPG